MRYLIGSFLLALSACASAPVSTPACTISAEDRAWIDNSLHAWRFSTAEISSIGAVGPFEAVFFDDDCVLSSTDAFSAATVSEINWQMTAHDGQVTLPNGQAMPAVVTAFAAVLSDTRAFFVMSTPSVWRAGGVTNEALGLETMMTAVLLHEGAHVTQARTFGARMAALAEANNLPETFNDDSIQEQFSENTEFVASVERETELLFQAAAAPDEASARSLARDALILMQSRRARWFVGDDAELAEAEDIWLTLEGSGQWVGYHWLIHPAGAGAEVEVAMPNFARRANWWSQTEGLALALAVDRLARLDWKQHAFGDGAMTLTAMLEASLVTQ